MTDLKPNTKYLSAFAALDFDSEASVHAADKGLHRIIAERDTELAKVRHQRDSYAATIERLRADAERAELAARRDKDSVKADAATAFMTFRRTMTIHYLKAREQFEAEPTEVNKARHEVTRDALALVYTSEGGHGNREQVLEHIDRLGYLIGEQWVELWAHREGCLPELGSREIVAIADDVRAAVATGTSLDEIPMWVLADEHLGGGL